MEYRLAQINLFQPKLSRYNWDEPIESPKPKFVAIIFSSLEKRKEVHLIWEHDMNEERFDFGKIKANQIDDHIQSYYIISQ